MYELADRPPKAGSLKESLFLSVWLKRQEIELAKWRVVAQGAANASAVGATYGDLITAIFPFSKGTKKEEEKKMIERMKKEVARGPIMFKPIIQDPFREKVKRMTMPNETLVKLKNAATKAKRGK
jgi:hypothetical protein